MAYWHEKMFLFKNFFKLNFLFFSVNIFNRGVQAVLVYMKHSVGSNHVHGSLFLFSSYPYDKSINLRCIFITF